MVFERFHKTLLNELRSAKGCTSIDKLQVDLDLWLSDYNE
jgi:Integrase core domain